MAKLLPSIHYPAAMAGVFSLFAVLQAMGMPLVVSTYVPVLLLAGVVTWLERVRPNREEWRPPTGEIGTDPGFMVAVQLALPPLVGCPGTFGRNDRRGTPHSMLTPLHVDLGSAASHNSAVSDQTL